MLEPTQRARLESELRDTTNARDWRAAATLAIRGYGPEILGYLLGVIGREADAEDAFSEFCVDLWRGLPDFRGESSLRTWAYRLAHNVAMRGTRREARRMRIAPLVEFPDLDLIAEQLRSDTLPFLRTAVRAEVARLREQLTPEERTLLILRLDRRLAWEAIARITSDLADPDAEAIKRDAARARKRYERVKQRLRDLARPLVGDT